MYLDYFFMEEDNFLYKIKNYLKNYEISFKIFFIHILINIFLTIKKIEINKIIFNI